MQGFVGVMDSGVGGLTVLAELARVAPTCNFLYLADHAFCPYGTKTFAEIRARVLKVANFLQQNNATSIVVACNTASVFAADVAAQTHLPVYDVIAPTCQAVTEATKTCKVALLATNATVKSGAYQNILARQGIQVVAYPCSNFVPLVEQGATSAQIDSAVASTLDGLPSAHCDTVILGCTHFPFLKDYIAKHTGNAQIVSCDGPVAQLFAQNAPKNGCAKQIFYTTGNPNKARLAARPFANVAFAHVDL